MLSVGIALKKAQEVIDMGKCGIHTYEHGRPPAVRERIWIYTALLALLLAAFAMTVFVL